MKKLTKNKRRILLVEDNHLNLLIMSRLLQNMDIDVTESTNGEEAVKHAIEEEYSMIFMCVFMPISVGCEVAKKIREKSVINKDIPIIAVSSFDDEITNEKVRECGIADIISKPLIEEEILALFNKYSPENASIDFKIFNQQEFESFYSEESLRKDILSIFMEEKAKDLEKINKAFASNDKDLLYDAIHYMKGSFNYLKAENILGVTQEILDLLKADKLGKALYLKDSFISKYNSLVEELDTYADSLNI